MTDQLHDFLCRWSTRADHANASCLNVMTAYYYYYFSLYPVKHGGHPQMHVSLSIQAASHFSTFHSLEDEWMAMLMGEKKHCHGLRVWLT